MSTPEKTILDALTQIQNSVASLKTKYKDIEAKIETKHNDIEAKIDETPKKYAEIIKLTSLKESKIEQQIHKQK